MGGRDARLSFSVWEKIMRKEEKMKRMEEKGRGEKGWKRWEEERREEKIKRVEEKGREEERKEEKGWKEREEERK